MNCGNCGSTNHVWWKQYLDPETHERFESCSNCRTQIPECQPNLKDQTEFLIHQNYTGKTRDRFIENHRRDAAKTEREIGWDGNTTRKQREQTQANRKLTIEERRRRII